MKKITLILGIVDRLQQFETPVVFTNPRIVSGRNPLCPKRNGVIQKRLEFDLGITQNVRVGCPARFIFLKEFRKNPFFVLSREIYHFNVDTDHIRDSNGIEPILPCRTIFIIVIVFPVFHEKPDHFITLFFKQPCRDRRIDATGHADHHFFPAHDFPFLSTKHVDNAERGTFCPFK